MTVKEQLEPALSATQRYLLGIQRPDGHWCGELEGDTILESEYILCKYFLGRGDDPKIRKAASSIRSCQLADGGWAIYPGGRTEISASVKAYLVLKLLGDSPDAPHMIRARDAILAGGGLEACNSFTKIQLSMSGLYDWNRCPAIPPEMILLPRWFYLNIYEMSSWSRAIVIPLSIIWALKPTRPLPGNPSLAELYAPGYTRRTRNLWSTIFEGVDLGIKLLERFPVKPSRELAIKRCERWIMERIEDSDGLGAIFPGIVNVLNALDCLGYDRDHASVRRLERELAKLEVEQGDTLKIQPCKGPVWDTALAMNALSESGMPGDHPSLVEAARWILNKRGNAAGDWRFKARGVDKPGWFFEYANPFYPDNDTTAKVVTALSKIRFPEAIEEEHRIQSMQEAHEWHLSMQNSDGGWAAFDKGCTKEVLTHVPFADHNAMIDPSNEDITARVLETFSCLGHTRSYPPAGRAIDFLRRTQAADGSWYGRWGCNYLYGTWLALWGLQSMKEDMSQPWIRRSVDWFRACQNEDGGWGELPESYDDARHKGRGPSTASQTAWAILGQLAAGEGSSASVRRGVEYLLREQREDGAWSEEAWTGTGFPGVFYLRYHLYGIYFPLLALSVYRRQLAQQEATTERQTA